MNDIRILALDCLLEKSPLEKVSKTQALYQQWLDGELIVSDDEISVPDEPGRPNKPELVEPRDLPRRRKTEESGNASLIHAICHIEFNAINLALDAVARFAGLPKQFYADWMRVAFEESQHFVLLREHLLTMNSDYGEFPAHSGMWDMAKKTHHDPLIRMALVPRVLEARGLDVTPKMMNKLRGHGELRAVEILEIILNEEIGHVKVGTDWFNYLCDQRSLAPLVVFKDLLDNYFHGELRGPFFTEARKKAGFTDEEMALLEGRG